MYPTGTTALKIVTTAMVIDAVAYDSGIASIHFQCSALKISLHTKAKKMKAKAASKIGGVAFVTGATTTTISAAIKKVMPAQKYLDEKKEVSPIVMGLTSACGSILGHMCLQAVCEMGHKNHDQHDTYSCNVDEENSILVGCIGAITVDLFCNHRIFEGISRASRSIRNSVANIIQNAGSKYDAGEDAGPDAGLDAVLDAGLNAGPVVDPDEGSDAGEDVVPHEVLDAGPDERPGPEPIAGFYSQGQGAKDEFSSLQTRDCMASEDSA